MERVLGSFQDVATVLKEAKKSLDAIDLSLKPELQERFDQYFGQYDQLVVGFQNKKEELVQTSVVK